MFSGAENNIGWSEYCVDMTGSTMYCARKDYITNLSLQSYMQSQADMRMHVGTGLIFTFYLVRLGYAFIVWIASKLSGRQ